MNILVTGGSGILGSYLPRNEGLKFTDRDTLDITDYSAVKQYIEANKPTHIVHLASMLPDCKERGLMKKVNVQATSNLVKIARDNGLKRFIFTSSCAVYKQEKLYPTREWENVCPQNSYGETKLMAESEILKNFDDAIIFRIFNIYGGNFKHSLVNKLLGQERMVLFDPNNYYRDYIHYSDVVEFIIKALSVPRPQKRIINLGSGIVRSTREILRFLEDKGIEPNYEVKEDGKLSVSWANICRLRKSFNYEPRKEIVL
jgi:nucleoside-diphosphate-sugar epimerase